MLAMIHLIRPLGFLVFALMLCGLGAAVASLIILSVVRRRQLESRVARLEQAITERNAAKTAS